MFAPDRTLEEVALAVEVKVSKVMMQRQSNHNPTTPWQFKSTDSVSVHNANWKLTQFLGLSIFISAPWL